MNNFDFKIEKNEDNKFILFLNDTKIGKSWAANRDLVRFLEKNHGGHLTKETIKKIVLR